MEFKLGDFVRKKVQEKGLSYKSVSDKIGMTPRGLDKMLNGNDMKMSQVIKLSDAVGFDFVGILHEKEIISKKKSKDYSIIDTIPLTANENENSYETKIIQEISFQLNVKGAFEKIQTELPAFMEIVRKEAESRGLHLA